MDILYFFVNYSNSIIAFFNIILTFFNIMLIYFVFLQLRDARKPIIITKIISRDKDVIHRPYVVESGNLYLAIINDSNNIAHSINIGYQFDFNKHSIKIKEKLSHLNPKEATKIILKYGAIREKYPDLFEETTKGTITKITPKETLKIDLIITILYNPLNRLLGFKYKIEDNYMIEWNSLKSYPNFEDHPIINCWNKRNGEYYIYKTSGSEFTVKKDDSSDWYK